MKYIILILIFASFSGKHFDKKYNQVEQKAIKLDKRITKVEKRVDALIIKIDSLGFIIVK